MNNLDSSNPSEDKGFNVKDVGGNFTYTIVKGDHNVTMVSVGENIKTDNKIISKLDPAFSESITEFKDLLKDRQATEEQIQEVNKNLDKLTKELEGIKVDKKIEDEDKKDNIKSKIINLAEAVVDIAPDVAEKIAEMTSLAPISEAIGKGVGYVSDLIKKRLSS